jgi:hypothetical protein
VVAVAEEQVVSQTLLTVVPVETETEMVLTELLHQMVAVALER